MPLHFASSASRTFPTDTDRQVLDNTIASYVSNVMWVSHLLIDTGHLIEAYARQLSGTGGDDAVGRLHPNWRGSSKRSVGYFERAERQTV